MLRLPKVVRSVSQLERPTLGRPTRKQSLLDEKADYETAVPSTIGNASDVFPVTNEAPATNTCPSVGDSAIEEHHEKMPTRTKTVMTELSN